MDVRNVKIPGLLDALRSILHVLPARAIYLYGSNARGDQKPDSDIDLLVVVDNQIQDSPRTLAARGYAALRNCPLPLELKVVKEADFQKRKNWLSSLESAVLSEGKLLHGVGY